MGRVLASASGARRDSRTSIPRTSVCETSVSVVELIAIVQDAVGPDYHVSGNERLIGAKEDEHHGGRDDDRERAADVEEALADNDVAAIVALRGGAWLTRILPLIDFAVLDSRTRPVAVFGLSEITTLVNIVGAHRRGLGVYDNTPAFLTYALKHYAATQAGSDVLEGLSPEAWMQSRLIREFRAFFVDVVSMIEGRGSERKLTARLVSAKLPDRSEAIFVGGNLTVLTTLLPSPYRSCIAPAGHWVILEDYKEDPARLDRLLAHLTLAGYWQVCEGVLLGDFHKDDEDLTEAVGSLLRCHIPRNRAVPILVTRQFGHTWPIAPIPVHTPATIERINERTYSIRWPVSALKTV